jgi:hypothetical protein
MDTGRSVSQQIDRRCLSETCIAQWIDKIRMCILLGGKSAYSCYPQAFALHDTLVLPGGFEAKNEVTTIVSSSGVKARGNENRHRTFRNSCAYLEKGQQPDPQTVNYRICELGTSIRF